MIKKTTIAIFRDGKYAGEYDWQGGIPLSVGETIQVTLNASEMIYRLTDKTTSLDAREEDQLVVTRYWFEISE